MSARDCFAQILIVVALLAGQSCSRTPIQSTFASPEEAGKALQAALETDNKDALKAIFGRDSLDASASGDTVSDRHDRAVIAIAMKQSWRWDPIGAGRKELIIGDEQWPFPAPLVKLGNRWQFDSEAGKNEVLARRIGRNELSVIQLCNWYVDVQRDYAAQPHDGKPAGLFAQRIRSTSGQHDGLYWETNPDEPPSPLGDLVAEASQEGYGKDQGEGRPFWGYRFRILTAQGGSAQSGKKGDVVEGQMSGGFALIASPAKYGFSGVNSFIVNQDGTVYEKDLGPDTTARAAAITEYNPDETWVASRRY